jgi:putative DNA primase/helicase
LKDSYFYLYNGKVYESVKLLTIENLGFQELPEQDKELYSKKVKQDLVDRIVNYGYVDKHLHEMKEESDLIALNNCLYNWKTDQRIEFDPKYWITSILDYDYNPNANCPLFKEWLTTTLIDDVGEVDRRKIEFVIELFGYSFYREHPIKAIFFIFGLSNTGKSRLFAILDSLMNKDNISTITIRQLIESKHASIGLKDKMLNIEYDVPIPNGGGLDLTVLKNLSGGGVDQISGEEKYKTAISFKPYAKMLFGLNRVPSFVDSGGDVSGRIHLLKMTKVFKSGAAGTIPDVEKPIIENERSGIFNWAMKGLRQLHENGFKTFSNREYFGLDDIYIESGNPIISFMNDCLLKTDDPRDQINLKELYQTEFVKWIHDDETMKSSQWNQRRFNAEIAAQCEVVRPQNRPTIKGYMYRFVNGVEQEIPAVRILGS